MSANVIEATDKDFQKEVLEAEKAVLVDFWAPWCGPCQAMAPILEEAAAEISEVKFVKVNVDENPETASAFQIMSIPTLVLFKGGQPVQEMIGLQSKESLKSKLENI